MLALSLLHAWPDLCMCYRLDTLQGSRCWTAIDAIYFWSQTISLACYDDVMVNSSAGKWIAIALAPVSLVAIATVMDALSDMQMAESKPDDKQKKRKGKGLRLRLRELRELVNEDEDHSVTFHEYVIHRCDPSRALTHIKSALR